MLTEDGQVIFGSTKDVEDCDFLMHTFIDKRFHQFETALFGAKWFDYRFMHPVQATYVFFHHYVRVYRSAFARHVDRDRAEYLKFGRFEDLFDLGNLSHSERTAHKTEKDKRDEVKKQKTFVSGVWRARQRADAMGLPYEVSIEACIRHTLRYWKRPYLPRPEQISSDRVCEAVMAEWEQKKTASVLYSSHKNYRNAAYQGLLAQEQHRAHLLDLAGRRADPAPLLTRFLDEEMLTRAEIESRFGELVLERALEAA